MRLREFIAIVLMIVLVDTTLFRGYGYSGIATFLLLSPALFLLGAPKLESRGLVWVLATVLCLTVARLVWYGSPLRVACAIAILVVLATAAQSRGPVDLRAVLLLPLQSAPAGAVAFFSYGRWLKGTSRGTPREIWLSVGLPLAALLAFSTLFVLANPDLVTQFSQQLEHLVETCREWIDHLAMSPQEVLLWLFVAWLFAGILRPLAVITQFRRFAQRKEENAKPVHAPLYSAFRNMMVAVIGLFFLYLVFEFKTLWLREFPPGFYYAGYAHEGAFWLTVALALATGILSLVFRGPVLHDPRLPTLRRLAWGWCCLNGLLAIAVYNRLFIYIGFNGLTHMRIVGVFGISAVVTGFALVVWKIAQRRDFVWLISRQLWALAATLTLYSMTPVDAVAVTYNVHRILSGDSSAVMQIGVQQIDTEGVLALPPLLNCEDHEIRAGVRALLADKYHRLIALRRKREQFGWTSKQWVDDYALRTLNRHRQHWTNYNDGQTRQAALQRFYEYAYRWY